MSDWIKNLKPGDKVIIKYNGISQIATVEKITPAGNIKAGGILFNKLGVERSSDTYHYSKLFLAEATPDAIKQCEDEQLVQKAKKLVNENVFSVEKAKVIISMLESSKDVAETSENEVKALSDFIFSISNSAEVEPVFQSKDGTEVTIGKELSDILNAILEQAFIPYIAKALYEAGYINSKSQREIVAQNLQVEAVESFWSELKTHSRKMFGSDFNGEFWDRAILVEDGDSLLKKYRNPPKENKN